jgi:hypothetical protein
MVVERNKYLRGGFVLSDYVEYPVRANRAFVVYMITFFGFSKEVEFF